MESTQHGGRIDPPSHVDPAADLELLNRARLLVDDDQFLDFGPAWYAPALATVVAGLSLFGRAFDDYWNIAAGLAALGAGAAVSLHDYRRRAVRQRASKRGAVFVGLIVLTCWAIAAAWGTATSTIGYDRFVPGFAVLGWLLTTALLLVIRAGLSNIRTRKRLAL